MKDLFETPDIYVIRFDSEDVISTSVEADEDEGVVLPDIQINP